MHDRRGVMVVSGWILVSFSSSPSPGQHHNQPTNPPTVFRNQAVTINGTNAQQQQQQKKSNRFALKPTGQGKLCDSVPKALTVVGWNDALTLITTSRTNFHGRQGDGIMPSECGRSGSEDLTNYECKPATAERSADSPAWSCFINYRIVIGNNCGDAFATRFGKSTPRKGEEKEEEHGKPPTSGQGRPVQFSAVH
ncbi:alpha/beta hydrolase [Anopheles sinensis]|uniref:Alpha/beta hydrolase n=1 Tax=Anopheles sinensis TaxID=74873 RepID=A0A084W609_ANOSI|nr:alpha/beta hydrolase [Anopheles sinensis]